MCAVNKIRTGFTLHSLLPILPGYGSADIAPEQVFVLVPIQQVVTPCISIGADNYDSWQGRMCIGFP
jgi:hypothetical protein